MVRTLTFASLVAAALSSSASAQSIGSDNRAFYGGEYQVISRLNGLCLNVEGGRIQPGAVLITWDCGGHANERFTAQPSGQNGAMRLVIGGRRDPLCVEAPASQGAQLRLARCQDDAPGQTWRFEARGPRALASRAGYCANIEGERQTPGARVISWPCSGAINEGWIFNKAF